MRFRLALSFLLGALSLLAAYSQTLLSDNGVVNINVLTAHREHAQRKIQHGFAVIQRTAFGDQQQQHSREEFADSMTTPSPGRRVPLINYYGHFYGKIAVGYPLKNFTVNFDTASADLFLPGPFCRGEDCTTRNIYDPESSRSALYAMRQFSFAFHSGEYAFGDLWFDTVLVNGVPAVNQLLGVAQYYSHALAESTPADGYLGMGFQNISNFNANPVFQTLLAQHAITEHVFSFKFAGPNPELLIGGIDNHLYQSPITYTPVTNQGFWQVTLDAVHVDGTPIPSSMLAIVDTGSPFIIGNLDSVAAFYKRIPGAVHITNGLYTVPCENLPPISFTFGGSTFMMDPSTFILGHMADTPDCLPCLTGIHMEEAPHGPFWVIGTAFLQNVYAVFDVGQTRVGLARLK